MSPSETPSTPVTPPVPLTLAPTLASWDRHDHPSQRALGPPRHPRPAPAARAPADRKPGRAGPRHRTTQGGHSSPAANASARTMVAGSGKAWRAATRAAGAGQVLVGELGTQQRGGHGRLPGGRGQAGRLPVPEGIATGLQPGQARPAPSRADQVCGGVRGGQAGLDRAGVALRWRGPAGTTTATEPAQAVAGGLSLGAAFVLIE
jgi:hypothetical protein